jgi:hypothetical protein
MNTGSINIHAGVEAATPAAQTRKKIQFEYISMHFMCVSECMQAYACMFATQAGIKSKTAREKNSAI